MMSDISFTEYITTLEGDIAERDRLLDYFRTKLGTQESENLALRQEIATLKKALLGGGDSINLPPPAPLPELSAAETLAASNTNVNTTTVQSSPLLTANTQKDLPSSPRIGGSRFWGGVGMGGGVTPVHTTLVPDISTIVRNGLQENMNPSLNAMRDASAGHGIGMNRTLGGFDGFADLNPFTMKTLDAYVFFASLYVLHRLIFEIVIACTSGEKWLLNSKCTNRIKHRRIIRTLQAWRPIYVLTSSPHPNPTCRLHQDMELRSLPCFRESTMYPIQILYQPRRPRHTLHHRPLRYFILKEALHYLSSMVRNLPRLLLPIHLLRCRRLRKNNSMLCWRSWPAKPSSANWAMRFGMRLPDLPPTPLRHLVAIGMLIKYVRFWKAKL
jgi:hypothetical protein